MEHWLGVREGAGADGLQRTSGPLPTAEVLGILRTRSVQRAHDSNA